MRRLDTATVTAVAVILLAAAWSTLFLAVGHGATARAVIPWIPSGLVPAADAFKSASSEGTIPGAAPPSAPALAPSSTATPEPTGTATVEPTPTPTQNPTATPEPTVPPKPSAKVALPTRLEIPAVRVSAPIEYVGLASDGSMGTPSDPDHVAWYRFGPRPGEPGNAAITGHVDWAGKIRAFWWLKELDPGDLIAVVTEDRSRIEFAVEWVRQFDVANAPTNLIFGSSDRPELTLITCGGEFDHRTHQYLSRVVVRAVRR